MAPKKKKPDAYKLLLDMINTGRVLPNERLIESDLARNFATSRAHVRAALDRLEQEGLVLSEPFRGARVRLILADEAIEILEVRAVLDVMLAGYAAERVNAAHKERLQALLKEMAAALKQENPIAVGEIARRVRETIWDISGHSTAIQMQSRLNSQLTRFRFRSVLMPGRAREVFEQMGEIVKAVGSGSADKSRKALRAYHDSAITSMKRAISADQQ